MVFAAFVLHAALTFAPARGLPDCIRPRGPELSRSANDAYRRSPRFRQLVTRIDALHGIVYVQPRPYVDSTARQVLLGAMVHAVTVAGAYRIVRFLVFPGERSAAVMAHEFQHVIEVLEAGATSESDVDALYARIGARAGARVVETAAATETERLVERELRRR